MPYNENDFLNGLAAGLTATASQNAFPVLWKVKYYIHLAEPCAVFCYPAGLTDWGDGSGRIKGNPAIRAYGKTLPGKMFDVYTTYGMTHEYAEAGDYVIAVSGNSGVLHVNMAGNHYRGGSYDVNIRDDIGPVFALSGNLSPPYPPNPNLKTGILQSAHFHTINSEIYFHTANYRWGYYNSFFRCTELKSITFSGLPKISYHSSKYFNSGIDIYITMTERKFRQLADVTTLNFLRNSRLHFKQEAL